MAQEQDMRRAEHKPLRISYGAGAHNEGLGRLRWTVKNDLKGDRFFITLL